MSGSGPKTCTATVASTKERCTAKAKIGDYCGRHAGAAARTATAATRTATESAKQAHLFAVAENHLKAAAIHMDPEIIRNLGILGLNSRKHNAVTIKKAFRDRAMSTHPDRFVLHEEKVRKAAEEQFKKVRAAFENLKAKLGM